MITKQEADILDHTSQNGRYVSDELLAIELGKRGLLYDHGPQALAAGAHYLVMTAKGRAALSEWRQSQPKPKIKKRRVSPAFESWRTYSEVCQRVTFSKFLKEIYPHRRHYA